VKLATGEEDLPPPGRAIRDELLGELAGRTTRVAAHFRAMCIRALDYCPPVDITFGDYLRALMTADADLSRDDPWKYRGAIVEAFRRAGITPKGLGTFSETALLWSAPQKPLAAISDFSADALGVDGDFATPPPREVARARADAFGQYIADPRNSDYFDELGLTHGADVEPPIVTGVHSFLRTGSRGNVNSGVLAQVVQRCWKQMGDGRELAIYGGGSLILDHRGAPRYVVRKRTGHKPWVEKQSQYARDAGLVRSAGPNRIEPDPNRLSKLCSDGIEEKGP
jgi:hypothetical protein